MIGARHHTRCSAERCSATITRGWFCKDHWFAIPKSLRDAVLAAFNAATEAHCKAPRDEQEELNRAYGRAFRECQDYLRHAPRTDALAMATIAQEAGAAVTYVDGRRL
ncbi:hypothetical protein OVY48_10045 [Sphingobium sp. SA2]|uniref:hypothetical protein n=1 Tax=Sphingobium sp. SA2 TaxID=1524832 RepID=UPI0028BFA3F8|nr:hypothetical protein [Sphingobium sp. SA2]MDT7533765.1 hypothetical protein [Sphingobium sp. SA2]